MDISWADYEKYLNKWSLEFPKMGENLNNWTIYGKIRAKLNAGAEIESTDFLFLRCRQAAPICKQTGYIRMYQNSSQIPLR